MMAAVALFDQDLVLLMLLLADGSLVSNPDRPRLIY
jgi:hypothetical protein